MAEYMTMAVQTKSIALLILLFSFVQVGWSVDCYKCLHMEARSPGTGATGKAVAKEHLLTDPSCKLDSAAYKQSSSTKTTCTGPSCVRTNIKVKIDFADGSVPLQIWTRGCGVSNVTIGCTTKDWAIAEAAMKAGYQAKKVTITDGVACICTGQNCDTGVLTRGATWMILAMLTHMLL